MNKISQVLSVSLLIGANVPALAQCAMQWQPEWRFPGTNGVVYATANWDPDGPGPIPSLVVVGGLFSKAGGIDANNIAVYDPVSGNWSPLGAGLPNIVNALAVMPSNVLVAGGWSTVARWDGTAWATIGSFPFLTGNGVTSLGVLSTGDLIAAGSFSASPIHYVARRDPTTSAWSTVGNASNLGPVSAMTILPDDTIVVGGQFSLANGMGRNIASWNGSLWSSMGIVDAPVVALVSNSNYEVFVGGNFTSAGGVGASRVARYQSGGWSALGTGLNGVSGPVTALTLMHNGDLVAGGVFGSAGGNGVENVARWDRAANGWSPMSVGLNASVLSLTTLPNGQVAAGGHFTNGRGIARWDGSTWRQLGQGIDHFVWGLTTRPDGDIVAVGWFGTAGNAAAKHVARWDGSAWHSLGSGTNDYVVAVVTMSNGDLVVGGQFTMAGGLPADRIARWAGSTWSPIGLGLQGGTVAGVATDATGRLVAVGSFASSGAATVNGVAEWTGSAWAPLGSGIAGGGGLCAAILSDGDPVVGGMFHSVGGVNATRVARWNRSSSSWSAMGGGLNNTVSAMLAMPDGDLIAGGGFTMSGTVPVNYVARWDHVSGTWRAMGTGVANSVYALTRLPNGHVVAVGWNGQAERWNGAAWSPFGPPANDNIQAVTVAPNGDTWLGGRFTRVGGNHSSYIARLASTCPASITAYGSGCSGSAGPVVLTADNAPWVGGVFRATATGMASNALAFGLLGLAQQNTPLSVFHPTGGLGCSLLANPDAMLLLLPSNGVAVSQFGMPNDPFYAGYVLRNQVLQLELDTAFQITALNGSNGLSLTIGAF